MNDKLITKWEKTGLLEPLDDSDKSKCADLLETAAILLTGELNKYSEEIDKLYDSKDFFTFAGLRAVRWLYGDYVLAKSQSLNIREVIDDFYKFCLKHHLLYVDLNTSPWDVETEFVSLYAGYFIESHKGIPEAELIIPENPLAGQMRYVVDGISYSREEYFKKFGKIIEG